MQRFTLVRKYGPKVALVTGSLFASGLVLADPIDVTAATAGVAAAQVAVLAVLAAMITMAAAVYGVRKVLSLLGR